MIRRWVFVGALYAAFAVAAGALGRHLLSSYLDGRGMELWETAARYLFYAGLGTAVAGLVGERSTGAASRLAPMLLAAGGALFALAVGTLAFYGPRWMGAVAPLGGLGMIAGFVALAIAARRAGP